MCFSKNSKQAIVYIHQLVLQTISQTKRIIIYLYVISIQPLPFSTNHSHSVPTTPIQYQPLPFSTNHSHSVPTAPIQYQPLPFSTNHSHSVPTTPIQYQPLPFSISKGCNNIFQLEHLPFMRGKEETYQTLPC